MHQNPPHPLVVSSGRCIGHRTIGCFVKVLLAQMCHNPSSEGIAQDVDHGPEPITDKENRGSRSFTHFPKVLEDFCIMFQGLTEPNQWPQSRRCQQVVIPQM